MREKCNADAPISMQFLKLFDWIRWQKPCNEFTVFTVILATGNQLQKSEGTLPQYQYYYTVPYYCIINRVGTGDTLYRGDRINSPPLTVLISVN